MHVYSVTVTSLRGDKFFGNVASAGGGVYVGAGAFTVEGITAISNTADSGGGLYLDAAVVVTNSLIADNEASSAGAGFFIRGSSRLLHNTVAHNIGGDGSGIYVSDFFGSSGNIALTNTIIVSQTVGVNVTAGSTATLNSTLWHGNAANWGGAGMINTTNNYSGAPAFINPAGGDYHLSPASAAVDKGINAGVTYDIDGDFRPQGAAPDLGADEYAATSFEEKSFLPVILKK